MGRLPFDPAKMRAREKAAAAGPSAATPASADPAGAGSAAESTLRAPAGIQPISVSQLAASVDAALKSGVPRPVRVIGEVSNFTHRTHWYFGLKDAESVVSCVMFQYAAKKAGFTPEPGHEVVVSGNVEFYAPQGRLTLRVETIEPVGAGALELAYRKLCEEVRALGWFSPERKRELPSMPRKIAVVTSRTGAALQDVIDTARRRAPFVEICLIDTLVQGASAAPAVTRAIDWVSQNAAELGIDTLIVTRGGGSMEDLWAFNDKGVAEAIVKCSIPVAAAIGHETDTTIAELVADARCATPTQAAMRCTPDRAALVEQVHTLGSRLGSGLRGTSKRAGTAIENTARHLVSALHGRVQTAGRAVERAGARLEMHRPAAVYKRRRAALDRARENLHAAIRTRLASIDLVEHRRQLDRAAGLLVRLQREKLEGLARSLELVGPASVLARGYSITLGPDGTPLRSAQRVKPGDKLETKLAEGTVKSVVSGLSEVGQRHGVGRKKPAKLDPGQQGLFGGA